MLWVAAVIFTIVAVIIGIKKWKRANNLLYDMEIKNRKAWVKENIKPVYPNEDIKKHWTVDPTYCLLPGNINHNRCSMDE